MRIVKSGVVFKAKKNTAWQSNAFADICILPSGRWLASCRSAPAKAGTKGQHVLLSRSDDEGETWSASRSPFIPEPADGKAGLFRAAYLTSLGNGSVLAAICWVDHSNPELPFWNAKTEGLLDTRIFFSRSDDNGETWSRAELMNTRPFTMPVPLTGPVLVFSNGELACQFELNKHYDDKDAWRHAAVLMFSRDKGKTWDEYSYAARDPENRIFYWDQRPGVLKDGRILNFFWTYDYGESRYLNIHARESKDSGRAWSKIWDTGVSGQPARPVSMNDGRTAMVYVDRSGPPEIRMKISPDYGKTFDEKTEYVIYRSGEAGRQGKRESVQDAWAEMEKFSVGLPVTAVLPDGDILVLFYAGPHTDLTDVRWARVRIK